MLKNGIYLRNNEKETRQFYKDRRAVIFTPVKRNGDEDLREPKYTKQGLIDEF